MLQIARGFGATCVVLATACGDNAPTSPSAAVTGTQPGVVEGVVYTRQIPIPRTLPAGSDAQRMRLRDVEVVTTEGPGSGATVTTDATGKYRLELPAGPFRLRWSKPGYVARDSAPSMVNSGSTTAMPDVMLDGPEWTITGVVTDGLGRPAPGAALLVFGASLFPLATGTSDSAGRFTLTSNWIVPLFTDVRASKEGYKEARAPFTCCAGNTERVAIDLRIVRILRVALTGPTVLRVGQSAALGFEAEFEDGSRETGSGGECGVQRFDGRPRGRENGQRHLRVRRGRRGCAWDGDHHPARLSAGRSCDPAADSGDSVTTRAAALSPETSAGAESRTGALRGPRLLLLSCAGDRSRSA